MNPTISKEDRLLANYLFWLLVSWGTGAVGIVLGMFVAGGAAGAISGGGGNVSALDPFIKAATIVFSASLAASITSLVLAWVERPASEKTWWRISISVVNVFTAFISGCLIALLVHL
jgi:hypothetical protein